jgi:hypothetical protein
MSGNVTASLTAGLLRQRVPSIEHWSVGGLFLACAGCALILLFSPFSASAQAQAVTLIAIGVPAVSGIAASAAGLRTRAQDGAGWILLSAGAVLWAIGQAVRARSGHGFVIDPLVPVSGDLLHIASLPLIASGLLAIRARDQRCALARRCGRHWRPHRAQLVFRACAVTWSRTNRSKRAALPCRLPRRWDRRSGRGYS